MYQAMYRKYRPLEFEELVGQDVIKKTILNEINNEKISHAYLFAGPRGTGKTTVAKLVGKLINCEKPSNNKPCNKCVSCTQTINGVNNDIIEIDAASNNGVDEIRELKSKVGLVPSNGKYKIYIIDEVHMMTNSAFNALLKTLEEPPRHVIFILATTDPQKIPTTILSRCQRFDFKKISLEHIINKLNEIVKKENIDIDKKVIEEIARSSDGGLRDAIGLLDQINSYADNKITMKEYNEIAGTVNNKDLTKFIDLIMNSEVDKALDFIKNIDESGKDFINIMAMLIDELRSKLIEKYKENNTKYITLIKSANNYYNLMKTDDNPRLLFELFVIENFEKKSNIDVETKVVEETIKLELKEESKKAIPDFETIKNIRINNALANLSKKEMNQIIKNTDDLIELAVNSKYKKIISILVDGQIKAYGNNQIVYVFKEEYCTNLFNDNLLLIEEILQNKTGNKYKTIAVNLSEWDKIKKEYNSKEKKYKYVEENINIQMFAKKTKNNESKDKINDVFGDIVNYK